MNSRTSGSPRSLMKVDLPARARNSSKRERTSLYQAIVLGDLPSVRLWNS